MTDLPADVIRFRSFRVIDCQGERRHAPRPGGALSALQGSVLAINPTGMDLDEILEKERIRQRAKAAADARNKVAEGFCELVEADSLEAAHGWLHRLLDGDKAKS